MQNPNTRALLSLLHFSQCGVACDAPALLWPEVYRMAAEQGVLAVAWDGVERLRKEGRLSAEQLPDRNLKLRWAFNAEQIQKRYQKQLHLAKELAECYATEQISTLILKGLAISRYYPQPGYRECGDVDCFLLSEGQKSIDVAEITGSGLSQYVAGNRIAEKAGAKVELGFYKHAHIHYKGLMVENHQFCTAIRGEKAKKAFERHLQHLLSVGPNPTIHTSCLRSPSADFNALFLTAHAMGHFLTEGIKLRHLLDWALLLKSEQENIDWENFYYWCDKMHFKEFANALTTISVKYLGLTITSSKIIVESPFAERVLEDILYHGNPIHSTRLSKFGKRIRLFISILFGGWKYHKLYQRSALGIAAKSVWSLIFEPRPQL